MSNNEKVIEITNEEEFNEIINSGKLVLADFFAEWCMPCLMLAPVIEELADEIKDAQFIKINTEDNSELSKKYNIMSIPCLIFFKKGKEIDRIIGLQSKENIEEKIENLR